MDERSANPDSPPAADAARADAPSGEGRLDELDQSLTAMTSLLLDGGDDFDLDGAFDDPGDEASDRNAEAPADEAAQPSPESEIESDIESVETIVNDAVEETESLMQAASDLLEGGESEAGEPDAASTEREGAAAEADSAAESDVASPAAEQPEAWDDDSVPRESTPPLSDAADAPSALEESTEAAPAIAAGEPQPEDATTGGIQVEAESEVPVNEAPSQPQADAGTGAKESTTVSGTTPSVEPRGADPSGEPVAPATGEAPKGQTVLPATKSAPAGSGTGRLSGAMVAARKALVPLGPVVTRLLEPVATRLEAQPRILRHSLGWLGMLTLFNAVWVWSYVLIFRGPPAPPPTAATGLAGLESVESGTDPQTPASTKPAD